MRRITAIAIALVVAGVGASAARAAAPRLILVDQCTLGRPLVLADWGGNGTLLVEWHSGRPVGPAALRGRPSFRLSFMWGQRWNDYVESGRPLRALRPSDTEFHGRFWPAWRGRPAVLEPGHGVLVGPHTATRAQLRILAAAGVPVRIRRC